MYCFLKYIDYEEYLQYEAFNLRQIEKAEIAEKTKINKRLSNKSAPSVGNKSDSKFEGIMKKAQQDSLGSVLKSTSNITYYDEFPSEYYTDSLPQIDERSSKDSTVKDASVNTVEAIEDVAPVFENKQLVFNPNCFIKLILDYIYNTLKILDPNMQQKIDFCSSKGYLCNIQNYNSNRSGLDVFQPKGLYYIVFPDFDANGKIKEVKALLSPTSLEYEQFKLKKIRRTTRMLDSSSLSLMKRKKSGSKTSSKGSGSITTNKLSNKE